MAYGFPRCFEVASAPVDAAIVASELLVNFVRFHLDARPICCLRVWWHTTVGWGAGCCCLRERGFPHPNKWVARSVSQQHLYLS